MSDILREVDEAMRVEKMTRLWAEHGNTVIAAIVALILGTALSSGWNAWQHHQHLKSTSALLESLQTDSPLASLETLGKAEKGNAKAFSLLTAAAIALDEKSPDQAIALYKTLAADSSVSSVFRHLALVQKVAIELDGKTETSSAQMLADLAPIIKDKTSPWQARALLLSALVKAHKNKDNSGAIADLETLSAIPNLSPTVKEQAFALRQVYKLQGAK